MNYCLFQHEIDEFDTTISGPWMKKWEIVHINRHVESLEDEKLTWHAQQP